MSFHVGQLVECIVSFDAWMWDPSGEIYPEKGKRYHVRQVRLDHDGHSFLLLAEIRNVPLQYVEGRSECAFDHRAFRPITEHRTDISIFHEILNTAPIKVREPALTDDGGAA